MRKIWQADMDWNKGVRGRCQWTLEGSNLRFKTDQVNLRVT